MQCLKGFLSLLFLYATVNSVCAEETVHTYFNYSEQELSQITSERTEHILSIDQLKKWDALSMRSIEGKKINFYDFTRLFTYLYVAQSDFAILSHRLTGKLSGSFDPISKNVLFLFLGDIIEPQLFTTDPFSQAVAKLVVKKVEDRFLKENSSTTQFSVPEALQSSFSAGLQVAKWTPWFAKPSINYWPSPPPSSGDPIWKEQIKQIKEAQNPMTEEKKEIIYRWAGLAYPWSDDWRSLVNGYLFCHNVSLQKTLQVRSLVMVGLYDCIAAYTTCKYRYLVIRPQAFDPSIKYEIKVPRHPSYPSGHSTESTVTSLIMSFFFPQDSAYWKAQAAQCCISRIWAGIHFPLDDQAGQYCGKKVAEKTIEAFQNR